MEQALFKRFIEIAYEKAGIALKEGKETLVSARIAKRKRALGIASDRVYLEYLENDESGEELVSFLDAISTNFTNFFRESDHFEEFTIALREWLKTGQKRFRVWCAASSSGEEPYSLAITMAEVLEAEEVDWKILATDISTKVLKMANEGLYEAKKVETIPKHVLHKYFAKEFVRKAKPDPEGDDKELFFRIKPFLREKIIFKRLNLAKPPFPMQGPLDAIFCRNVMIYFDNKVRQGVISESERLLKQGGLFITGHSETLTGIKTCLLPVRPSIYTKKE